MISQIIYLINIISSQT